MKTLGMLHAFCASYAWVYIYMGFSVGTYGTVHEDRQILCKVANIKYQPADCPQCETSIPNRNTNSSACVESRIMNQSFEKSKILPYNVDGEIVTFDMNSKGLCKHHSSSRKSMVSRMEAWYTLDLCKAWS